MATPFKRICLRASQIPRQQQWRPLSTSNPLQADALSETDPKLDQLLRQPGVKYTMTEEPDKDLGKYKPEDLSSLAHRELEQHRELREMVRLAAWEMPFLSALSKKFEPPQKDHVLRWRYTTYMGEAHPASRKVVVTFDPFKLSEASEKQIQKLLKLAGPRYNPTKQQIKLSCESFETPAQNKRYLADTVSNLIAEAKDPNADTFEDVPLDLRHHKPRVRHHFPKEWVMSNERRMQLEGRRREVEREEARRIEGDGIADGVRAIEAARETEASVEKEEEPVMVEAKRVGPQVGKTGRRGR